jgi:hypothetical protein
MLGLTNIYNLFHNRDLTSAIVSKVSGKSEEAESGYQGILELRKLHREMDEAVLAAYDWTDLHLGHDFHVVETLPESDSVRYTISPKARKELLKRLLALNHQRSAEEKAAAAAIVKEKAAIKPRKMTSLKSLVEPGLFDVGQFVMLSFPTNSKEKALAAVALSIVAKAGDISSMDHLDVMLLATHPEWCKTFLSHSGRNRLESAEFNAPKELFVAGHESIMWKDCRDYLEKSKAFRVDHSYQAQIIHPRENLMSVAASLKTEVADIVAVALEAHKEVQKLRLKIYAASEEQKRIFQIFDKRHQEYQLAV